MDDDQHGTLPPSGEGRKEVLNLPAFDVRVRGTREKPQIFDFLRRRYVALTPEEWVRQHFVHFLVEQKGYPPTLLANEVSLAIGDKRLRADSVLYDRELRPRMIIEYKSPEVTISQETFHQISAYNQLLHVEYLVVSNGLTHYCLRLNREQNRYDFLPNIPSYQDL